MKLDTRIQKRFWFNVQSRREREGREARKVKQYNKMSKGKRLREMLRE